MKHAAVVAMVLGLVAGASGTAARAAMVGKEAPEIQAQYWMNSPALALQTLRGKIVVVEFWATWCPPCRASIPHLVEMNHKFAGKGAVFISLTDEDRKTVEPFAREMKMDYAVGGGSRTSGAYGVTGIPHAFIVDPSGRVAWEGHPMGGLDRALEEQLKRTPPAAATEEKDPRAAILDRVGEEIQKQNYLTAAEWLAKVEGAYVDLDIKRRVEGYRAALAKAAARSLADAERRIRDKAWHEASIALETAAKIAPGSEEAKRAEARLAELLADEKARPAIERGRREASAAQALVDLDRRAADMEPAAVRKALKDLAGAWPETKAGQEAAARAAKMGAEEL